MGFLRVVVLIVLTASGASAQAWKSEEFDARKLTYEEKRIVQAALAFSGDYVGLLDGAWGSGSQRSLEVWSAREVGTVKPEFRHLHGLLVAFAAEVRTNGWETFNIDATGTSYAAPFGILTRQGDDDVLRWGSADGGLSIIAEFSDTPEAVAVHGYMLGQSRYGAEPYQSFKATRLITAVEINGNLHGYARSDLVSSGWFTLTVFSNDANKTRMQLTAGSMQKGRAPPMTIPSGGLLALILQDGVAPPGPAAAASQPVSPETDRNEPPVAGGSGTGFYVNNTDLVTAAHVIEGCGSLTLSDGTVLTVVGKSKNLDLAVLSSAKRSETWIALVDGTAAVLGEQVTALGYPYLGLLQQGLTVTGGNVSALAGLDGGSDRIMFSAPVQPGNSGGPLLNAKGLVVGVVVARTDDLVMLKETGTLPQNMNLAVPPGALAGFLRDARVVLPALPAEDFAVADGIPDAVARAVVPILCR